MLAETSSYTVVLGYFNVGIRKKLAQHGKHLSSVPNNS